MKKISAFIIFSIFFINANLIYSQQDLIKCQLFLPQVMPSMIYEWQLNPTLIRLELHNYSMDTIDNIDLQGTLTDLNSNSDVATIDNNISGLGLKPKASKTLFGRDVINISKVHIETQYKSRAGATGRIPEGNYTLCINVTSGKNKCEKDCAEFIVIIPDPVNLILPLNGDTLSNSTLPVFNWTPVLQTGIQQENIKYSLKIVPVFEGQILRDAVDKNPVMVDKTLLSTTYQYLPADPPFTLYPTAKSFAWRVKALNADGSPATRNDGYSEPRWFYIQNEELPPRPRQQIDLSIKNWNKNYGTNIKAVNWSYEGEIKNEIQRIQILQEMTNPEKAWFPSGNVLRPDSITALRITDDKSVKEDEISKWRNEIDGKIKVGHHIVKIKWTKAGQSFISICISDNDSLIYDSMLFNIMLVEEHHSCFNLNIEKLWLVSYGEASICLNKECKNGALINCLEPTITKEVNWGEGVVNWRFIPTSQNCCAVEYCYLFTLGFGKIKTGADGFSLEVVGRLGSVAKDCNKVKEDCCTGN